MEHLVKGTRVLVVDRTNPEAEPLTVAADLLRGGRLVAFPTETVYGLGANATDGDAVSKIFEAKGRPADNPLIVHVADRGTVMDIVSEIPPKAMQLMELFWPGPLTLVLPKRPVIPDSVTCGLNTVAVRMPDHPVALALIRAAGVPLAAPSANRSGRPSPTTADHVLEDLAGLIDVVLDGGETGVGLESTVIDMTVDPPVLLRPGGVTLEMLQEAVGRVNVDRSIDRHDDQGGKPPRSPGMKYRHYAPAAPLILVDGEVLPMQAKIKDLLYEYQEDGIRVGIMCGVESRGVYQAPVILEYGSREDLSGIASSLFGTLRAFDRHQVEVILAEGVPTSGIGLAIMNRLRRAAGGRVVVV
ncbi:MAG TPA: L-threonylcarbamoyladenylate synthase [Symbiobacteriaceae bacterium]|jgi:L-threonylcarbamoyladenylate synthase